MVSSEIDKAINEYCAKEIYDCIESGTKVPKETLENFIKSLTSMIKSETPVGPECASLWQTLYALYVYRTGPATESEDFQYNFDVGAIYACTKMLDFSREMK